MPINTTLNELGEKQYHNPQKDLTTIKQAW